MTPADEIAFRDAIAAAGLVPPKEVVSDGRLHRFPSSHKGRDDAGWCIAQEHGSLVSGTFGCWRQGRKWHWTSRERRDLTSVDRMEWRRQLSAARIERQRAEAEGRRTCRDRAAQIIERSRTR